MTARTGATTIGLLGFSVSEYNVESLFEPVQVATARWLRFPDGKTKVWKIDPEGCLAVSDEQPAQQLNYNKSTAFDGSYSNVLDQ